MTNVEKKTNKPKTTPGAYPSEIKREVTKLFHGCLEEYETKRTAARHVAELLGIGCYETVLTWVKQSEVDSGARSGITTTENEEIKRLRRENAELKRANGILKAASAFFASDLDRPQSTRRKR